MNIVNSRYIQWWHWIVIPMVASTGIGLSAFFFLVNLPNRSSCESDISGHDAAAIIYCANKTADAQNPQKLVQAIDLVNEIPKSNPLRSNSDRLINKWLQVLLRVSEQSFHTGDFPEAINALEELPENIPNYANVQEKIQLWQAIWQKGENTYQEAKAIVKQEEEDRGKWYKALQKAKELKRLDNEYWASNKYYELIRHIQAARERAEKNEKEEMIAQREQEQERKSPNKFQDESLENLNIFDAKQVKEDFAQLRKARKLAESGKIDDMRMAISEASLIISDAHYDNAQKFINDLEKKIHLAEDKLYLANASQTANNGDKLSLQSAINEASLVRKDSAIYPQARKKIQQWESQIANFSQAQTKISHSSEQNVNQSSSDYRQERKKIASGDFNQNNDFAPLPVFSSNENIPATTFTPSFQEQNIEKMELELINQ